MKLRTLFGLSLVVAVVLGVLLSSGGSRRVPDPALTSVVQAHPADATSTEHTQAASVNAAAPSGTTAYLPVVYGPPAVAMHTVAPHDAVRFSSGGETWEIAKAGTGSLRILKPYGAKLLAKEQAPYGSLAIYAFSRSTAYFDTSDVADRTIAGDLTLTYYNENTRQPLDLSVGILFRHAPASPATTEMWHQFEDWPLLASQPVTTSFGVTRTLDADLFVEADGTLPETLAVAVQTTEPRLAHGQSIYSEFKLARMKMSILLRPEERSRER